MKKISYSYGGIIVAMLLLTVGLFVAASGGVGSSQTAPKAAVGVPASASTTVAPVDYVSRCQVPEDVYAWLANWHSVVKTDVHSGRKSTFIRTYDEETLSSQISSFEVECEVNRSSFKDMRLNDYISIERTPMFAFSFKDSEFIAVLRDDSVTMNFDLYGHTDVRFTFYDKNKRVRKRIIPGYQTTGGFVRFENEEALALLDLIMTNKVMLVDVPVVGQQNSEREYTFELSTFKADDLIKADD
jgi:hypothetical protein